MCVCLCTYMHTCMCPCVGYMCVGMCSRVLMHIEAYGCSWVSSLLALHLPETRSLVETETPKFG